jgi:hypothetical protein
MNLGIVTTFDNDKQSGEITDTLGNKLSFFYKDGQNMLSGDDLVTPKFSGHHEQPSGYSLKLPAVGDPVSFIKLDNGTVRLWGYVRHFMDLVERKHGTRFAA